jgi:hypothetical protein
MGTDMKTTIEIADALLSEAKAVAAQEGTTLCALVEQGLREALARRRPAGFTLRKASVRGKGLQPGIREGDWEQLRDLIYEGHGA